MSDPAEPWEAWAPPLDPPTDGGLPYDQAEAIAGDWWDEDPHLAAALMWEAYAATLPPSPAVAAVSTGAQSVSYSPAAPTGDYGLALQRAAWHRSFVSGLATVPLCVAYARPQRHDYLSGHGWPPWYQTDLPYVDHRERPTP